MEFKNHNQKYKFWHSPIALLLLFIFLVFFMYNIIGLVGKERETSHKKELALQELGELRDRKDSLNNDIHKFNTEEGQEEIIREKYQVAKEGEKMVIIVDDSDQNKIVEENKSVHVFWNLLKSLFDKNK